MSNKPWTARRLQSLNTLISLAEGAGIEGQVETGDASLYAAFQKASEQALADYATEELVFLAQHYDRMSTIYLNQLDQIRAITPTPQPRVAST